MQFNSFLFLVFFATTYSIYLCCHHKWQNRLLLLASYIFYGAWDYRFLLLIFLSTTVNYIAGLQIGSHRSRKTEKIWLWVSVATNLAVLGFFKYFNFFVDLLSELVRSFGWGDHRFSLSIVLPVGISFYTFQTMSYTIDIYRKRLPPTKSFLDFSLYVAFFPQLVAGPIERATNLLPQICAPRTFSMALFRSSSFLFLFGLFEKTVVADNLAIIVDTIYGSRSSDGLSVLLATYGFAIQIFADFDGYSNMAKGLAGLMGFTLMVNFNAPYFSLNPSEFWSRWHISLSTWLRDYLYIPLGGNRYGIVRTIRNLFVTMFLGGLWHGANWTFVLWGVFHGVLLAVYLPLEKKLSDVSFIVRRLVFFHFVCIGWMLFRAENVHHFNHLVLQLFTDFNFSWHGEQLLLLKKLILYSVVPISYQYLQYKTGKVAPVFELPLVFRAVVYTFIFYMIVLFGFNNAQSFIYFQF